MYPIERLLETGVPPNLIENAFLLEHCPVHQEGGGSESTCLTSIYSIEVITKTNLHEHIRESLTKETFPIFDKLAVNSRFRTSYIIENMLGMLP